MITLRCLWLLLQNCLTWNYSLITWCAPVSLQYILHSKEAPSSGLNVKHQSIFFSKNKLPLVNDSSANFKEVINAKLYKLESQFILNCFILFHAMLYFFPRFYFYVFSPPTFSHLSHSKQTATTTTIHTIAASKWNLHYLNNFFIYFISPATNLIVIESMLHITTRHCCCRFLATHSLVVS